MKKSFFLLPVILMFMQAPAQNSEYLQQKEFKTEKQKLWEGINTAKKQAAELKKSGQSMRKDLDSLEWKHGYTDGKLGMVADSLEKTAAKLNALDDKVNSEKILSRGAKIILALVLLGVLCGLVVLIFLARKRADRQYDEAVQSLREFRERLDIDLHSVRAEIQSARDQVTALSREVGVRLTTSEGNLETRIRQQEQSVDEKLVQTGGRIDALESGLGRTRDELGNLLKGLRDSIESLKKETDNLIKNAGTGTAKKE